LKFFKMMVTQRTRRTREVTGPTPHSVAIFARPPNKRPPEYLILDRRKQEDQRQQAEELTKYNKLCDLKNDWEKCTDKKIQVNTVKRRVNTLLKANEFSIEDRRERLRDLLSSEEANYVQEMADKEETVLERQAKMRERARQLKEKREKERMDLVHEKLEQQFRNQCEELRSTVSKREMDQIAAERMEQLRIKSEREEEQKAEDEMYAELWYADMQAKARREEEETKKQMLANRDTLEVLQRQMAALEAQRQQEKLLVEEEARILAETAELRKLEEMQALEEKKRKQEEIREMYGKSLQMKQKKQAREMQEQLAFDLKMLEQLLVESRNEAMEQSQRKRELRDEDRRYRQYLRQLKEEEQQREKELDSICDAEVEKMWEKKIKQWKLEKEARRQLMQEVMASRRQQLLDKLHENERQQEQARMERDQLLRKIEENKELEAAQIRQLKEQHLSHQNDLIGQIEYNSRLREAERMEQDRMFQAEQEAEAEYRRKVEELRNKPVLDKMHPMRRRYYQTSGQILG